MTMSDGRAAEWKSLNARDFLNARKGEFLAWGLRQDDVLEAEREISNLFGSDAHSWFGFWRSRANRAFQSSEPFRACLLLGAAKYPVLGTAGLDLLLASQRAALRQIDSESFETRVVNLSGQAFAAEVRCHVYPPRQKEVRKSAAIVCLIGGLDTYKCEMHLLARLIVYWTGCRVIAVDAPGTGESRVPANIDQATFFGTILDELAPQRGKVCALGISFGGYWAVRLAFSGLVDSAIDIGGPIGVEDRSLERIVNLPMEMQYVLMTALRLESKQQAATLLADLSQELASAIQRQNPAPLLAINGSDDPYVPREDITFLKRFPNTTVLEVDGASHCAQEKLGRLIPRIVYWIRKHNDQRGPLTEIANIADLAMRMIY